MSTKVFILAVIISLSLTAVIFAQNNAAPSSQIENETVTVPAGTKVMLALIHPISTKSARVGDGVYLKTTFPVVMKDFIVIPPGTYVQGEITAVERHIRVKGRAQLRFRFTTFIFPNGYTVSMPGALRDVPGMETGSMKDKEGTIQANGDKAHQAANVGEVAATGAVVGAAADGLKGVGIGGGAGAVAGLAVALLTHGPDVRLETGTAVEMVLQRGLVLDKARLEGVTGKIADSRPAERPVEQRRVLVPPPDHH